MAFEVKELTDKPEKWPANAIECQLENILVQLDEFKKDPSYKNKEVLVSLVSDYDLNQRSMLGLFRTTDYEVARINTLFAEAHFLQLNVTVPQFMYKADLELNPCLARRQRLDFLAEIVLKTLVEFSCQVKSGAGVNYILLAMLQSYPGHSLKF